MPIKIPKDLPANEALRAEKVYVIPDFLAETQDIRPLKVAIVNLMPTTLDTEMQLLRLLGNTPLQVDITLVRFESRKSHHAPNGHLETFYVNSKQAMKQRYDGLIITGAPVETMPFENVDYWHELQELLDYSQHNVWSTLHICWGAQAGLYHRYGICKQLLPKKLSGIFAHDIKNKDFPLFRGFDDEFLAPQSRYTESDKAQIEHEAQLTIQSESEKNGVFVVSAREGREVYVMGHLEYDPLTLDIEYKRDSAKGLAPALPENYYPDNIPNAAPIVRWRAHAHLFFSNWLNYVYQETPYCLAYME
ncbi:MAG: homoserine O-succinyltransferase [Treponemataceae bacterium]|nr:MAG: homoserine O-succinyltransferase [Treponemataceae bacterium]